MAEGERTTFAGVANRREYGRLAVLLALLVAVILVASLLPFALSTGSGAGQGSPLAGAIPMPGEGALPGNSSGSSGPAPPGNGSGGSGGLGALNPAASTEVGGSIETNPFQSNDTTAHFVVTSSVASYWRTGAFRTYTGSGWEKPAATTPYQEPIATGTTGSRTAEYQVELRAPATALPTVWRPRAVDAETDLAVTSESAVRVASDEPLEPGTTYEGRSRLPPRDIAILQAAGRSYPASIEGAYTALPNETASAVGPFTRNLTRNASTPYETAVAIEDWLESSKNYSLRVSEPPSDDVATQFIFEMDRGYCEYFATAMTVMLRSQDVPARYVVGYSTGQPVGENTYLVRNMNAHAWVEVYFPDVGWVRFDPTPGSARLRAEQRAMNETPAGGANYNHTEVGSPGEKCSCAGEAGPPSPGAEKNDSTEGTESQNRTQEPESPDTDVAAISVDLNRTPVPGATVNVTVTRDNQSVPGATVLFNGRSVGTTDETGSVIAAVPYTRTLNVSVVAPGESAAQEQSALLDSLGGLPSPTSHPGVYRTRTVASHPAAVTAQNETNRSFRLPDRAAVTIQGTVVPNGTAVVAAEIQGVPVRDAPVTLAGETVGRTSAAGTLLVSLPTKPGNYTVRVQRGSVRGNTTFQLHTLSLSVEPTLPLALPGTGIVVNASRAGEPAAGVPVRVAGQQVGGTGASGLLQTTLPFADSATVQARQYGQVRRVEVSGLYRNAALVGGSLGGILLLGFGVAYWRGYRPRDLWRALLGPLGFLLAGSLAALVALSTALERLPARLRELLRQARQRLADLWAGRVSVEELLASIATWLREMLRNLRRRGDERVSEMAAATGRVSAADTEEAETDAVSIRQAWTRFLDLLSVTHPERRTPGELARHAIHVDSLPAEPVLTVLDGFREVEYGHRPPDAHLERVETAIETLEAATEADADGD